MAKKYIYDGVEYYSTYTLRQDIWEKEHKVFVTPTDAAGWQLLGVTYIEEDDPEPSLEDQKAMKLAMLERAFLQWYENDATVTSSLGFVADSDARAVTYVLGLITVSEAKPLETRSTVAFMDHENVPHMLSLDQLKTLQLEIIQNGQYAYQQKWSLRTAIETANDKESLNDVEIKFVGKDFTEAAE